ncbi:MAG TPA: malate/lactate/ureidoglycolate dehydrogenase [Xanthobacteraceae bacterium]|nr:malate/lactate/ureidoglycolate dehydrogenase [Xanthobacteraceae bacterium]
MPATSAPVRVNHQRLDEFVVDIFAAAGSSQREARLIARQLVDSNLRGHDSHGVGSIPVYIRNVRSGDLPLNQSLTTVLDTPSLLVCDGNGGAGQVMAHDAMALGITKAEQCGVALVGLRNSHHIGRIGHWAEQCADAGLASVHFVNVVSTPSVAPFGGGAARIGTNPFAIGIPRGGERPIILDFATSKLAVGKVRVAMNSGKPLPPGALLTADGEPTTDPSVLFGTPKGVLLPFGEHKGWGLALACELLGAALTGGKTQTGPKTRDAVINCMLSILICVDRLGTGDICFAEIDAFIAWARSGNNAGVLLPGDPEAATTQERLRDGIPIDAQSWADIVNAAADVGVQPSPLLYDLGKQRPRRASAP